VPSTRKPLPHLLCLIAERSPGPLFSSFAVAANDLDPVRLNRDRVLHLESHILDQEGPHLIAEAVSVKMSLDRDHRISLIPHHVVTCEMLVDMYLEGQPCLDLIRQNLSDATIEVREDLHGQLRFDAPLADEIIESVCQCHADAGCP
jgi:hypothetical protein